MIPELSVFDINQTVAFYKKIGFQIIYERREDLFIFMSFAENQFMFEQIHDEGWNTGKMLYPLGQGVNFSIAVDNIDRLYEKLINSEIEIFRELTISSYRVKNEYIQQKEFLVQDPNGYLLRFTD